MTATLHLRQHRHFGAGGWPSIAAIYAVLTVFSCAIAELGVRSGAASQNFNGFAHVYPFCAIPGFKFWDVSL